MYLFGGKFCMFNDGLRECTCEEIVYKHPLCRCDRKHFNNILWATVTVFQVSGKNSHQLSIVAKKIKFEKYQIPRGKMTIILSSSPIQVICRKKKK